ncbi:MAG: phosphopantothenoylcysteine decarboxylase/phosphopantothenate--cysteine ligase [Cocleimonas sp.]|jgi:phosphopantothenoylcysteine decarboxylase/phosphopantothenate--cysteine ligase
MSALNNKRILIGISGGIAAYKTAEFARALIKNGAEVRVCMTKAATEFITPLTLQALTGNPVHSELLDPAAEVAMGHIELARWADLIMIAPASADLIARLAHGHANDLLSTICLATETPIHIAPAMNRLMWSNAATQNNCKTLSQRGYTLHGPAEGEQACGETGAGRMLEAQELADIVIAVFNDEVQSKPLFGKTVLITAGPTREAIDPVRYISNRSSGKMGYAIAEAAQSLGADVQLVSGPVALEAPNKVTRSLVESASQMHDKTMSLAESADIFIATAAVADYSPANIADQKIKKDVDSENINKNPELTLALQTNKDILSDVSHAFPNLFSVGFAAETENLIKNAQAKLQRKKLDMIVANQVGENKGFDKNTNQIEIIWHDGQLSLPEQDKKLLAIELMKVINERFSSSTLQR